MLSNVLIKTQEKHLNFTLCTNRYFPNQFICLWKVGVQGVGLKAESWQKNTVWTFHWLEHIKWMHSGWYGGQCLWYSQHSLLWYCHSSIALWGCLELLPSGPCPSTFQRTCTWFRLKCPSSLWSGLGSKC